MAHLLCILSFSVCRASVQIPDIPIIALFDFIWRHVSKLWTDRKGFSVSILWSNGDCKLYLWSHQPSTIVSICSFDSRFEKEQITDLYSSRIVFFTGRWSNANWRQSGAGCRQHGVPRSSSALTFSFVASRHYVFTLSHPSQGSLLSTFSILCFPTSSSLFPSTPLPSR